MTERFIEWFWGPVSMTVLNLPVDECSAGALLRFFQMVGHNGESAVRSGAPAAERVLASFGNPAEIALPPPAPEGLAARLPRFVSRFPS